MPELAKQECLRCSLAELCVPEAPDDWHLSQFGEAMDKSSELPDHRMLCWQGDRLAQLFIVRRGTLKAAVTDVNGNEQIRGFYLAGELAGLDSLHSSVWQSSLEVLGSADICQISRQDLHQLMGQDPRIAARLLDIMSQHLAISLSWNGDYTAEQRIAAFLLNIYQRSLAVENSNEIRLDMSRQDIAKHLRLVTETVSRELGRLKSMNLIAVQRRRIRILDSEGLLQCAGPLSHLVLPAQRNENAVI